MRRTVLRFFILFSAAIAFIGSTAGARTSQVDPVEIIQTRASNVVNHVMQVGSARTSRFNAELTAANLLRPLDPDRQDSVHIQVTKQKVLHFLNFLGEYRDSSQLILHALEDSIAVLRSEMPRVYQETFLSKFLTAYTADLNAVDATTLALSVLYKEVITIETFMENSRYEIKNHALHFADDSTLKQYQEYSETLNKLNADVAKAGQVPVKTQKALQKAIDHLLDKPNE